MTALAETQARIASVSKLRTVVAAMRGMAATHAQQARGALAGFRAYADVVEAGLARAIRLLGAAPAAPVGGRVARVVFGAEHGFAGAYPDRLLDAVPQGSDDSLFLLGARTQAHAVQRGWRARWTAPMASQAAGVEATARRAADALYAEFAAGRLAGAELVFARTSGAGFEVERRTILPISADVARKAPEGPPPLVNLEPRRLVERLIGEHVFAQLALAALESFASENAARLATMESARVNIDDKLDVLTTQESQQRQEEITAEVQDVVAGALASQGAREGRR
ncbi:MAG TPA: F0F1 ATP synthase subunit gamma [Caulobacteraceae bacterium]|nr:F0F1 ATP synthase subunit gamma [Caulobacteraceae bacterium]